MVNKCCVFNCRSNYIGQERNAVFTFPADVDMRNRWIKFVNRKDWQPSSSSVICVKHFEDKYLKKGEQDKRYRLDKTLKPIPTIYPSSAPPQTTAALSDSVNSLENFMPPSVIPTVSVPRKSPTKRIFRADELPKFIENDAISDFTCLDTSLVPPGYSFTKYDDHVVYYKLVVDSNSIPVVTECIRVDDQLHVQLFYKSLPLPLPQWFRYGRNCKLTHKSMLENFSTYIRTEGEDNASIFDELRELKFQKRPIYSAKIIRYALLLRYSSIQAYKMLLDEFPLPSLSLLEKISQGGVDPIKSAKLLLEKEKISKDVVLMIDEMYLQKSAEYCGGELIGCDEDGNLFKGLVGFMIVGLQKSIPYVIKSIPETKIEGEWLKTEIIKSIETLHSLGFSVRAVIADNHSTNVSAFSKILISNGCDKDDLAVTKDGNKIYLFFDSVHLLKNIRNNLLNNKRFLFPAFNFDGFLDPIRCEGGEISWKLLHDVHEMDEKLKSNLRKAPKLSAKALHPGNNKQSVPLVLAIFHETTSAAITSYFPQCNDASNFLKLINAWWVITNSKSQFNNNNLLGNAAILDDNKPNFLRSMADWIDCWQREWMANCERFTLTEQTGSALKRTLRCTASLIEDLLAEEYNYVLTSRFQSDPLERRYSQYRQMSGGRFLVGLKEVNTAEKILKIRSLLKEGINFWEEDLYADNNKSELVRKLIIEINNMCCDVDRVELSGSSREVAIYIAGYIAKKLTKQLDCRECHERLIGNLSDESDDHSYLELVSRGGLTIPSLSLSNYVCNAFAIIDFFNITIKQSGLSVRLAAETVLDKLINGVNFTCASHQNHGRRLTNRIISNIYFNNERKLSTDKVAKDDVEAFKKRQRVKRKNVP